VTKKQIREEVIAGGFENIAGEEGGEATINRWIEQVIREICDLKPWPFLYDSKEGAMPMVIANLGHVEAVVDLTNANQLRSVDYRQLIQGDPKLSSVGNAMFWFTEDGETIQVLPASSANFKVHFRQTPAELADNEEPIIPAPYHDLIVDGVRIKGYKRTDNFAAAAEVLQDQERRLSAMMHALLKPNYDGERRITRTGSAGDYL
jgi:hypothetical protein